MSFTPIAWMYSFPNAKSATKGIGVFKAKQVRSLIQLQRGIRGAEDDRISAFSYMAVTPIQKGKTVWLRPVSN